MNLKTKIIFITILSLFLVIFGLYKPDYSVADTPGSIWTTDSCQDGQQDTNHYGIGQTVYISGHHFDIDKNYDWLITGQPGEASCHPNIIVSSGQYLVTNYDFFCFPAYVIQPEDCKEYKVDFGNKSDNYRVDNSTFIPSIVPTSTLIPTAIDTPTPLLTSTPTKPPFQTNTPTFISTPTITNTPTDTPTDTLSPTPTQTDTPTITNTPVPTQTPQNSNDNEDNNNGDDNTNTNDDNVGGGESPSPTSYIAQSIIQSSPSILGTTDTTNYLIDSIKDAYGGQILGINSLPATASDNISTNLPSSNQLIDNHFISIPSLSILEPVYQSQTLGDQLLVGDNQILLTQLNGAIVYYGHNQYGLFSSLYQLQKGKSIFIDNGLQLQEFIIISKANISFSDLSVFDNATSADIFLVTCSRTYPNSRIVIKASLI